MRDNPPIIDEKTKLSFQFNNIVPIVLSIVSFVALYFGLSNKIDLLTQKVEYLVINQKEYFERNKELQIRVGEMQVEIKELQTKIEIGR